MKRMGYGIIRKYACYNAQGKSLINSKVFNGVLLVILFCVFSAQYVDAVISPQFGWWQYYAWRVEAGDVLYRDIYLFMPPYFVFFTYFLHLLFHNHFILYTLLVGLPFKIGCILLLYRILCRLTRPIYACLCVFCGACLSTSYNMDMWYDFNPITMLPCLAVAYLFMSYYESLKVGRLRHFMAFFIGLLLACIFCLKQTFGITYAFTIAVILYIIYKKEYHGNRQAYLKSVAYMAGGIVVGMLPLIVYLCVHNCWADFFQCILSVGEAKGGVNNIFLRCITIFDNFKIWVYIAIITLLWQVQKHYFPRQDSAAKATTILQKDTVAILIAATLIVLILLYSKMPTDFHEAVSQNVFITKWRERFYFLLVYSGFIFWGIKAYRYLSNRDSATSILLFTTLLVAHFFTGILSTDFLEPLYLLLYAPWVLALTLKAKCLGKRVKDVIALSLIVFFALTCLSCKIAIPYSWQGWAEPPISQKNIRSTVKGLEGIQMPVSVNRTFRSITDSIHEYCQEGDKVFQFANIPLFNVLTEKEIPTYVPITWFDVCPDTLAVQVARQLYADPPFMVIWHNMNTINWKVVEQVFRGGQRCGQREILKFYHDVVQKEYTMLYDAPNHRDGSIELWVRDTSRHSHTKQTPPYAHETDTINTCL